MTYKEKLLDPRWQKKRLEIFQRDEFTCVYCGDKESTLHVHHLDYGPTPWDIPNDCLVTSCDSCHEAEHEYRPEIEKELLRQIKKRRFNYLAVAEIAHGFSKLEEVHDPAVIASTILWTLRDTELMRELIQRYFDCLSKNNDGNSSPDDLPF